MHSIMPVFLEGDKEQAKAEANAPDIANHKKVFETYCKDQKLAKPLAKRGQNIVEETFG